MKSSTRDLKPGDKAKLWVYHRGVIKQRELMWDLGIWWIDEEKCVPDGEVFDTKEDATRFTVDRLNAKQKRMMLRTAYYTLQATKTEERLTRLLSH